MRLRSLTLHGIKPYPGDIHLDLEAIKGQVVAITGENGAGKTRLMESWPGAMYRKAPTHGPLAPWATMRDSFVEASFVNGSNWTIRQSLDAVSGKGEALLTDGDGRAVLESTKVRELDGWVASHLPAPEVFLASLFSAQGTNGLLGLNASERKAVVLRALGVESLEAKAELARQRRAEAQAKIDTQRTRIDDERARGGDPAALEEQLGTLTAAVTEAEASLAAARADVETARVQIQEHDRQRTEAADSRKRRADLQALVDQAAKRKTDLETRVANNQAVLADADAIRAAEAQGRELEQQIATIDGQLAGLAQAEAELDRKGSGIADELLRAGTRQQQAKTRLDATKATLATRAEVEAAAADVERLTDALSAAEQSAADAETELELMRGQRVAGDAERIEGLRGGLQEITGSAVPGKVAALKAHAQGVLAADDKLVSAAAELPAALEAAQAKKTAAGAARNSARVALDKAKQAAHRAPQIQAAAAQLPQDEQAVADAAADLERIQAQQVEQNATHKEQQAKRRAITEERTRLAEELGGLKALRAKLQPLEGAEARLAELEPQILACDADVARIETDLGATPEVADPPSPPPALSPYLSKEKELEQALTRCRGDLAVVRQKIADAQGSAGKVAELQSELSAMDADLSDWVKLADDLGKKGIQALLIDAAGPEISEITNDLLQSCFGTRYTVSFETIRLSSDGKKEIEDFKINVIDTEQGRDADGADFSGGQRVVLNEALSLAFTIFNCKRNGVSRPTLIRDETGAALSAENSRRYMAMLRRAVDIVGADKLLFVSHNPETWELADNRITVSGEGVVVS